MSTSISGITLSNPDRIVYPENGITKARLAEYYVAVANWILPHIIDRPLTLLRCPQGRAAKCFVQRHWTEAMPEAVGSVDVGQENGEEPYVVIHDLQGLISLIQMNVLELHPWGARVDRIERPDVLVFDLDPGPGVAWEMMQECAVELRDFLQEAGLESFSRTSGGAGLHVVSPIARRSTWNEAGDFAHQVALRLVERSPKMYVANMRKDLRKGRIFIDYVRNRRSATAIASYSTRARAGAPVATPFDWEELPSLKSAAQFDVENVVQRLTSARTAVWRDYFTIRQSITAAAWKQVRKT